MIQERHSFRRVKRMLSSFLAASGMAAATAHAANLNLIPYTGTGDWPGGAEINTVNAFSVPNGAAGLTSSRYLQQSFTLNRTLTIESIHLPIQNYNPGGGYTISFYQMGGAGANSTASNDWNTTSPGFTGGLLGGTISAFSGEPELAQPGNFVLRIDLSPAERVTLAAGQYFIVVHDTSSTTTSFLWVHSNNSASNYHTAGRYYVSSNGIQSAASYRDFGLVLSGTASDVAVLNPPAGLSVTAGDTLAALRWLAPNSPGILDYLVEFRTRPDGVWTTFSHAPSSATTLTVTGLANGIAHDFRVSAVTSGMVSPVSNVVTGIPEPPVRGAKVFLIGDSTVCDYDPASTNQTGWGQVLFHYFENSVIIVNDADSGESTKSFYNGSGFWPATKARLSAGDYLFIQFGHNDSHDPSGSSGATTPAEFKDYLQRFIDEAEVLGVKPVLISPMYRRMFENGILTSYPVGTQAGAYGDLGPYAAAMQEVASTTGNEHVPLIDLFAASGAFMQAIGDAECIKLLQANDRTHWNRKGATVMAALVARGVASAFSLPVEPVPQTELTQYLRLQVLNQHLADIDRGLTFPRPVFTLEKQGDRLWLDWFMQPSGVTLQKTNNPAGPWSAWDIGAGPATGGDGLIRVYPQLEGIKSFFRLISP